MANRFGYMTNVIHTIGADGKTVPVSGSNPLPIGSGDSGTVVTGDNVVSTLNSTLNNLGIGGIFTGVGEDVLKYVDIKVSLHSDQDSAESGLSFQFSTDNINWFVSDEYTYFTNGTKTYSLQRIAQFFRIQYTNGAIVQTDFDLNVIFSSVVGIPSSHRIGDTLSDEDDVQVTKSVLSASNPVKDQINIGATTEGALITSVVTPTGSLPVSQLTTLHDGKILNRLFPETNEIVGTGTGTFQSNKYQMDVTSGEWMVHTAKRFAPYYSGKPQKVELTFDNFAPEANVIKRVGYFSSDTTTPFDTIYDGFWLESGGGTIKFVMQRAGVTTLDVDITNWNGYDVLAEYQTLATWDNFTVIEFNFLWLGGAYIELRVVTSTGFTTVHNLVYAGTSQDVFIQYPNQPVRYEIRSTTGSGTFRYICNQVATAGSIDESGLSHGVDTGLTALVLATIGVKYPVIGVRKNELYKENSLKMANATLFVTSNDRVFWSLEINPTLSAPLTYGDTPNSSSQYAVGNGTITVSSAGNIISSGFLTQEGNIDPSLFVNNYLSYLSGQIDGTQDEYVLCATPITSNVSIRGAIGTLEG